MREAVHGTLEAVPLLLEPLCQLWVVSSLWEAVPLLLVAVREPQAVSSMGEAFSVLLKAVSFLLQANSSL